MKALKQFADFLNTHSTIDGYMQDGKLKAQFGRLGKKAFTELAEYLDLSPFEVNFNKSGDATSGDLRLMVMFEPEKGIYCSLNKDGMGLGVLYRTITHMKDFTGGSNHYFKESDVAQPEVIKEKVDHLIKFMTPKKAHKEILSKPLKS